VFTPSVGPSVRNELQTREHPGRVWTTERLNLADIQPEPVRAVAPPPGVSPKLGPYGTQVMTAVRFDDEPLRPAPAAARESTPPPRKEWVAEEIELPKLGRTAPTLPIPDPIAELEKAPVSESRRWAPAPVPVRSAPPSPASQKTTDFDVSAVAPYLHTPLSGIRVPVARDEDSPPPVLATRLDTPATAATVGAPPAPARTASLGMWIEQCGRTAKKYPLPTAAGTVLAGLVLALATHGAARIVVAGPASSTSAATATSAPVPRTSSSVTAERLAVAPPNQAADGDAGREPVNVLAATGAAPAPSIAVGHLAAGRYVEAEAAYRSLSAQDPRDPSYAAIARMLNERQAARCRVQPQPAGCPEVKP
jgi:hypothetical protein